MAYRIAGIDICKKMLAVVVADVEGEGEHQFERRQFGTTPDICDCDRNGSSSTIQEIQRLFSAWNKYPAGREYLLYR